MEEHANYKKTEDIFPKEEFQIENIKSVNDFSSFSMNESLVSRKDPNSIVAHPVTEQIITTISNTIQDMTTVESIRSTDTQTHKTNSSSVTITHLHDNLTSNVCLIVCLVLTVLVLILLCCLVACYVMRKKRCQYDNLKSDEECDPECPGYSRPLLTSDSGK